MPEGTSTTNVYAMRVAGGEPWALTALEGAGATELRWSPDGQRLAFLMTEPPTEAKKALQKAKDDVVRWGEDFDFTHVYTIPFLVAPRRLPKVTQITGGRFHAMQVRWMPDGEAFALVFQPTPEADDWPNARLATVPSLPADDGEPHGADVRVDIAVVAGWGPDPMPSPDGAWIACVTGDKPVRWGNANRVVLYPAGGGAAIPLAATPDGQCWLVGWSLDGRQVYVGESGGIDTHVWALPITGAAGAPVLETETYKSAMHSPGNDRIAFVEETFYRPNAVHVWSLGDDGSRQIAAPPLPERWPQMPMPDVEVLYWEGPGGLAIEGVVTYPQGREGSAPCPLVVAVHGGPAGVFQRRFLGWPERHCDVWALAEQGIAVLRANPRGSSGYGQAFRYANYEDWGGGDFGDILAGVETLIERGAVDPDRLGIMGWSYGGYMTSWAITQTDRFRAACVGAGVTNLMSFTGTADIPGFLPDYLGGEFWSDLERYARHSALFNVEGVTTPTLIQHGKADVRVPLGQGRELYNALKRQGVPVKMVIYPRQGHGISEPRMRINVRQPAVDWFVRWLLGEGS